MTEERLRQPIKSKSHLLAVGEEGFLEKSDYERRILKALDAVPVERNSGIDGFLREFINGHPVSIRIQKESEDIETARRKLMTASKSKKCSMMILVRTRAENNLRFFDYTDDNLLIIDAYDLIINSWLEKHNHRDRSTV